MTRLRSQSKERVARPAKFTKDHSAHVLQDGSVEFAERIKIDDAAGVRRTNDGYLVATPRVARTGVQLYAGIELGRPEMEVVRVYRPPEEVFKPDSMRTFAYRPITNDHPPVPVTADNWKKYASGLSGGEIAVDAEKYIRVPMSLMDQKAIQDFEAGKKELSCGYSSRLKWGEGMTPDNEVYDCQQTDIRINHIALVKKARGGSKLTIGDADDDDVGNADSMSVNPDALLTIAEMIRSGNVVQDAWSEGNEDQSQKYYLGVVDDGTEAEFEYPVVKGGKVYVSGIVAARDQAKEQGDTSIVSAADALLKLVDHKEQKTMNMVKKVLDGITVDMSDIASEMHDRSIRAIKGEIDKLNEELAAEKKKNEDAKAAKAKDEATIATHVTTIAARDAEIVTLKKQVEDGALTPAKLDALVKDRHLVIAKASAILGDKLVVDGKGDVEIKKQVVDAKLGEKAKGWSDDQIAVSFDTMTADIDVSKVQNQHTQATDSLRQSFQGGANGGGTVVNMDTATKNYHDRLQNSWKNPGGVKTA